jgi:crotonobetainyl-CoA:carnitine CoA-transferase CaiB-like acyl-CoA transferase
VERRRQRQMCIRDRSSPIKMSLTPVRQDLPPPMLGQHTAEVMTEVLGWTAEQQDLLRGKGVI